MDGSCPATTATCPGVSGSSAIFFTSLISALLKSEREIGSPDEYPLDASQYLRSEYDFIVVGGGTAGSAVAARLSEVPEWNILLIEAGGDPPFLSNIPATFFALQQTAVDWQFKTIPQEHSCLAYKDRRSVWARGKVLGGSSVLNGMLYFRGFKSDFDRWATLGNKGWSGKEVLEFFKKLEHFQLDEIETETSAQYHGTGGPMNVARFQNLDLAHTIMKAAKEKGYTLLDDINGPSQHGFAYLHGTIVNGTRCSTAKGYLGQAKERKNLHVLKYSHVSKINIDPVTKQAKSIEFISKDGQIHQVYFTKEVIISAGTINSAQLLMLSGIGPEEHLKEIGIKPVLDLKVGQNLQEHVISLGSIYTTMKSEQAQIDESFMLDAAYEYLRHRTGFFSTHFGTSISGFFKTKLEPEDERPDVQMFVFGILANSTDGAEGLGSGFGLNKDLVSTLKDMTREGNVIFFAPAICRPKSRGEILLKSSNPFEHPLINPRYLSNPKDVETLIEGTRLVDELMETQAMNNIVTKRKMLNIPACNVHEFDSRNFWECMIRHVSTTAFHAVGTCKMGPSSDQDAVVDPELRVHGLKGIRVADISIMPKIISTPTAGTAMMIGEKAADMIKKAWLN